MALSLKEIYDQADKAIIYISQDGWMDKWKIQKGVFYFLWLYSVNKNLNFRQIANKIEIHPDDQGPFSFSIGGEVESLIKEGYLDVLNPDSKNLPVKASQKGIDCFLKQINKEEEVYLSEIKNMLEMLNSDEVIFFIYFNPYIPNEIKDYFISKSQMKEQFIAYKEKYIKKLLKVGIIDNIISEKIRKSIVKIG